MRPAGGTSAPPGPQGRWRRGRHRRSTMSAETETAVAERIEDQRALFECRLRAALTMEQDCLTVLQELEASARNAEVRRVLAGRAQETLRQLRNLEWAFRLLGKPPEACAAPATGGLVRLVREGVETLARSSSALQDGVALSAALSAEHYKVSAYQTLVVAAEAVGEPQIQALLQENLEHEQQTTRELAQAARLLACA